MRNVEIDPNVFFEQVYTHAPIGVALLSVDGMWIKVNPALCRILGYSQEELMTLTFSDITHPEDKERNITRRTEMMEGLSSLYETEKRYIGKNGNTIWASLHVSLVRDETHGTPLYFIAHIIDISEKKATEQKLLETEQLYHLISDNALDIISYITPDGITRYISPSVRDLLGYEPEELIGRTSVELHHPEDLERIKSGTHSDQHLFTYRVRHKNGNYIWFETTTKIIRDDQGNVQKVLGIGRDITERKKYEDFLAEAQRIAALGSWEWDIQQHRISLSEEIYRIFDLDQNSPVPSDLKFLIHPSDRERFSENIDQALKGHNFSAEFRHLQSDGSVKYLNIRASVTFNDEGVPVKMNGTTQDITERKLAEMKLQESVERYTSLKKYNHDAVISLDLQGRIINTNEMAERLTGYNVREMSGMNIARLIGVHNRNAILSGSINDANAERNMNQIRHKDGHHVEVLTSIAPIIIHQENVGFYIIAKDITDQKQLMIAKEAAEKTNQAKSEFLAMMSHEIRTPMNGVIGITDLLLTTDLDSEQREYVEMIQKSGNSLLKIINDILDFSKIESGKTELMEEPFCVKELVAEALKIFLPRAIEKNLNLKVTVSPDVPSPLVGDSQRLRQVLMNLIGNAVKFTFSGGVDVAVDVDSDAQGKAELRFRVRDTGIGIPAEKQSQLFEPFYQLDHYMTRRTEGSGLGLAISKKLVELMGGTIWIEQTDGPGAVFVFTASFQSKRMERAHLQDRHHDSEPFPKRLNILIAEDNEINQIVLKKMVQKLGHSVSLAENGTEVVRAAATRPFDMIFMDIHMPVMNGLEAVKALRDTLPADKRPFIVAVTAKALKGDRETCLAAGMDEYISKPVQSSVVSDIIDRFHQSLLA
ncbi:PAS domain S-box protein [Paenibacillus beijingensis]|uniref:Circadian input-output histidine kinase CikA n=1 Tax=Paenibacillus beijingensis TaxID=1126833 RepID=A0A0D5NGJ4_9BACL|nr:PAS domain S-box protein [Paenibacillus beijingensis]AJY74038.1 hypothetical protein VN24_04735 [Paenibacillus beijingensis]